MDVKRRKAGWERQPGDRNSTLSGHSAHKFRGLRNASLVLLSLIILLVTIAHYYHVSWMHTRLEASSGGVRHADDRRAVHAPGGPQSPAGGTQREPPPQPRQQLKEHQSDKQHPSQRQRTQQQQHAAQHQHPQQQQHQPQQPQRHQPQQPQGGDQDRRHSQGRGPQRQAARAGHQAPQHSRKELPPPPPPPPGAGTHAPAGAGAHAPAGGHHPGGGGRRGAEAATARAAAPGESKSSSTAARAAGPQAASAGGGGRTGSDGAGGSGAEAGGGGAGEGGDYLDAARALDLGVAAAVAEGLAGAGEAGGDGLDAGYKLVRARRAGGGPGDADYAMPGEEGELVEVAASGRAAAGLEAHDHAHADQQQQRRAAAASERAAAAAAAAAADYLDTDRLLDLRSDALSGGADPGEEVPALDLDAGGKLARHRQAGAAAGGAATEPGFDYELGEEASRGVELRRRRRE